MHTEEVQELRRHHEAQAAFIENISHALQTPLTILMGNLEVARSGSGEEAQHAFWVMELTIERMSHLVNDLLAIARMNASGTALRKECVSIRELIEEAYDDCYILAEQRGITLRHAGDDATVLGERDKLKEVVMNLISNSLKHTYAGGTIALECRAAGEIAEIIVRDSGSGIAPEHLPHIFDRFYRINGGGSPGTGIGLHICREIVKAHGGTISAQSEPGKGSVFTIKLPVAPPGIEKQRSPK